MPQSTVELQRQASRYRAVAAPLVGPIPQREQPAAVVLRGRGTTARIFDSDDNLSMAATPEFPIYGLQLSPDGGKALLYSGGARYTVVTVDPMEEIVALPQRPPNSPEATGFGPWHWLDDHHLLGGAQIASTGENLMVGADVESLPPHASLLYVYDMAARELAEVEIDNSLSQPFWVDAASGWHVTLVSHISDQPFGAAIESVPAD